MGGDAGTVLKYAANPFLAAQGDLGQAAVNAATSSKAPKNQGPGQVPTPDNSTDQLNAAAAKQRQYRGAYDTIFAGRPGSGMAGGLTAPMSAARTVLGT